MTILFSDVTKSYGKEKALDQITLEFQPGKIYGLLGPNGSGKSTTLKLITGLVYPNQGKVTVLGEKVTRKTSQHVAYLTELDMFHESFTVEKILSFYASQFPDFNLDKAQLLLQELKLEPQKKVKKLSKGNRGRLKLVLTLARTTPIILLDEPFSGLDAMVREAMVTSLLKYLDFSKQTVIIATHEINEVESLLDEVLAIYNGQIVGQEHVETLREEYGLSVLEWFKMKMEEKGV
ncbi:ABC-2 type transport system ATP-binding protein [Lederbergia galactosidilyticus]|uniref:ABC transporter ATP-binding protein n=1 Tax=Lederbergia galactosidilytica TaxID=217031 RepID=UPI001AE1F274|nr:ABC transporter ATP-binding protein [Lederbergia galactosidilytica]MBP1916183.1 ABC-2 type transport system ATP-binding protein [Lederbergia galactosidilytica]